MRGSGRRFADEARMLAMCGIATLQEFYNICHLHYLAKQARMLSSNRFGLMQK